MAQQAIVPPQDSPGTRTIEFFRGTATSIAIIVACVLAALLAVTVVFAASIVVLQLVALIGGVAGLVFTWSIAFLTVSVIPIAVVRAVVGVLESLEPFTGDREVI